MTRTAAALVLSLACASAAAGDATVEARQASMKAMAAAAKTIAGMFDGKRAYDATAFKAAAKTLRARTGPASLLNFRALHWVRLRAPGLTSTRPGRSSRRWQITSGRWPARSPTRPSGRRPVSPTT